MFYPKNFPVEKENALLAELLLLQSKNLKITSKALFLSELKKIIKGHSVEKEAPMWQYRFLLERHSKKFKRIFYKELTKVLIKTAVRSQSGIIPVAVFTKGVACPFSCLYCANVKGMPKSYFADEPAVMRAIRADFDPFAQTIDRLIMFYLSGHPIDKVDLIIQGGTFSFLDKKYREWFVKRCFEAMNIDIASMIKSGTNLNPKEIDCSTIEEAQKINENGKQRVIGITVETRPDFINEKELWFLRKLGVTRVELGVQTTSEKVLKIINRQHTIEASIKATNLLKDFGFKITYHLMPGLPGSNLGADLKMLKEVFSDERFKPDNLKFYPCSVVKHSPLEKLYEEGKYQPYNEKDLTTLIIQFKKKIVPRWLRIQRLIRDLTKNDIVVDSFPSNLRQKIEIELKRQKIKCSCIRCREIKNETQNPNLKLKITLYKASNGEEYFLEDIDVFDRLYGLLRLRLTNNNLISTNKTALVRELHIYGGAVAIGKRDIDKPQHTGLGKDLLLEAEKIAREKGYSKIAIIAGIGVRKYYETLGYTLEKTYMVKTLI